MITEQTPTANGNKNVPSDAPDRPKKRAFGIGFWLILLGGLIVTAALCVEFVLPGTLSRMSAEISEAARSGARQLVIVLFWKVVVPGYFIFYTILPIVLFMVIRKLRGRIAALEARGSTTAGS